MCTSFVEVARPGWALRVVWYHAIALLLVAVSSCSNNSRAKDECPIIGAEHEIERAILDGAVDTSVHFIFDPSCPACQAMFPHIRDLESNVEVVFHATTILDRNSVDAVAALEFAEAHGQLLEMLDFQHQFFRANRRAPAGPEITSPNRSSPDEGEALLGFVTDPMNRLDVLRQRNRLVSAGITAVPTVLYRGRLLTGNRPNCLDQLVQGPR